MEGIILQPEFDFNSCFGALTSLRESQTPFPWQQELFEEFTRKRFRAKCDIPTGLGKTAVIAVWLLALAHHAIIGEIHDFPRRLIYVVNRRTVVDQATHEVKNMRDALEKDTRLRCVSNALLELGTGISDRSLAISTLRGQLAANSEWVQDPSRPAVIIGTVDMVGSRLLFSGYGRGFKSRPLHAGFLGQDTMLVHDEAHLEPAFQELLDAITKEQENCRDFMKLRVMAMTATMRFEGELESPLFTKLDHEHPEVKKRIHAKKGIAFHSIEDDREIADEIVKYALTHRNSNNAILIYARTIKDVEIIDKQLNREELPTQKLTGTLRGLERDALAKRDLILARFMRKSNYESSDIMPPIGTVYLICTSAGEVGINISADHLVCDLTPFDSMAQRLGRVNRFGEGDAQIDIICKKFYNETGSNDACSGPINASLGNLNFKVDAATREKTKQESPFDKACTNTFLLLQKLPKRDDQRHDASPAALNGLPAEERRDAFTPAPEILPTTDILFDVWAFTSIRQRLPGRPAVADWLHGIAEGEPSEVHIAWREEVAFLTGSLLERFPPEDMLEDYPIKPHEQLRDRTDRVFKHLEKIAERCPELSSWLVESDGTITVFSLSQLIQESRQEKPVKFLADCTVLLPPEAGGLDNKGFLDGDTIFDEMQRKRYDVSDQWTDQDDIPLRCRIWDDDETPNGMRLIRTIDTLPDGDDEETIEELTTNRRHYWYWYVRPRSADDDGSRIASQRQDLDSHHQSAETFARAITSKLKLSDPEASAVILAARWHDLGKDRGVWQRSIGNFEYPQQVLAKSGGKMRPVELGNFRHEFGSLIDAMNLSEFKELKSEVQDLVLHLIAAHHGRARPYFSSDESFDPNHPDRVAIEIASEVPRRFAGLQRKYGRWGLAYLESLLRAADALASQPNDALVIDKTAEAKAQEVSR